MHPAIEDSMVARDPFDNSDPIVDGFVSDRFPENDWEMAHKGNQTRSVE